MREHAKSGDQPGPYRPMSPEMKSVDRALLDDLSADDLAKLSLDEPLLKWAYACVFLNSMGPLEQLSPQEEIALADMRRRGEEVSPILLKLIEENQETRIEMSILGKIEYLDTVRLEPYLEYSRRLFRERTGTMNATVAEIASGTLARHGTKEDGELLEWVLKERPYVEYGVSKNLKLLRDRLASQPATRPERRDKPTSSSGSSTPPSAGEEGSQPKDEASAASLAKPWIIGGLLMMLLIAVCRLILKRPATP